MKTTLHTLPINGGSFNCAPARTLEMDDSEILCNDIRLPHDRTNIHNVRLWVIGNEFGTCGAVWADCLQSALDELCDAGLSGGLSCDEPEDEDDGEDIARLGNTGEPHDLTYVWYGLVELRPERDWQVIARFAEARGAGVASLDKI